MVVKSGGAWWRTTGMEISKVVLINFGGVEGRCEIDLIEGLNQLESKSAAIDGIRYVLDSSFQYSHSSEHEAQSVEVQIRNLETDAQLSLTRTVQNPTVISIGDAVVPLEVYFEDFGEAIGCIGEGTFSHIRQCSEADLLHLLSNVGVQLEEEFKIEDLDHTEETYELDRWAAFMRKRIDHLVEIPQRNVHIRRCRAMDKCRKIKINKFLTESVESLNESIVGISNTCNDLQMEVQALKWEIVTDQQTANACAELRATGFWSFNSNEIETELKETQSLIAENITQRLTWMKEINSQQKGNFWSIMKSTNAPQTSKEFQLEVNLMCSELSKLPEIQEESLKKERVQLCWLYNDLATEFSEEQKVVEELFRKNEEFPRYFHTSTAEVGEQLSQEIDELKRICNANNDLVRKDNMIQIEKIKLRAKMTEIKQFLDYDESVLNGISSVLRLLQQETYRDEKEREFLGPMYQTIEFKAEADVGAKNYFRNQLKDWLLVIVVRTAAFAQKLMTDFNDQKTPGTISIISCDNYLQRAETTVKLGTSLMEVLVDGEDHPFQNLLSNIIYNEEEDLLANDGDCVGDVLTGGLTARFNPCLDVSTVNEEKWLAEYFETDIQLVEAEKIVLSVELVEEEIRAQFNSVMERLSELICLNLNVSALLDRQKIVQMKLESLVQRKETLKKIDWRQQINKYLLELIERGELKDRKYYEDQLEGLLGQGGSDDDSTKVWRYDSTEVDNLIVKFSHEISTNYPSILWPSLEEIISKQASYADMDIPHRESVSELTGELKEALLQANIAYREFLKWKGIKFTREQQAKSIDEQVQSLQGSTRGLMRQSVPEIEQEVRQLAMEVNVNPESTLIPRKTGNLALRLVHAQEDHGMKENPKRFLTNLQKLLARKRMAEQQDGINKLLPFIQEFYQVVRPEPVRKVELIFKVSTSSGSDLPSSHLSLADLSGLEIIFETDQGICSAKDLHPSVLEIFSFAVLFAKMQVNATNKVLLCSDCDHISTDTLEKILNLYLSHGYQIVLQRDSAVFTPGEEEMEWSEGPSE